MIQCPPITSLISFWICMLEDIISCIVSKKFEQIVVSVLLPHSYYMDNFVEGWSDLSHDNHILNLAWWMNTCTHSWMLMWVDYVTFVLFTHEMSFGNRYGKRMYIIFPKELQLNVRFPFTSQWSHTLWLVLH